MRNKHKININPTPVGGPFSPPHRKMENAPKNNDNKEPKLCDFPYISKNFLGLKMAKKGASIAFLLVVVLISGS